MNDKAKHDKLLFRPQAVEHTRQRLHGDILLARPVSHALLTTLFGAVALAIVVFFATFGYARKMPVSGVLVPNTGIARVVAGQAGTIVERRVGEGQRVKANDILFVLSSERSSTAHGETASAISALLETRRDNLATEQSQAAMQGRQRLAATTQRANDLATEVGRIEGQIALQQRRVALAESAAKRYGDLAAVQFISTAQLQDKTADLLDQQQRLHDLERAKASVQRDLSAAHADLQDQRSQARRDELAVLRNIAAVEQDLMENEARRRINIRAPQAGEVTAITAEPGQTVAANQLLANFLPEGATLEAELYVPSRAIGFLRVGMPVFMRYQAFPYQKFGQHSGRIHEVSRTTLRGEDLPGLPQGLGSGNMESLYRVRVALERPAVIAYGVAQPLKPGMTLEASITVEERRLYEWVLEPLFSITGKL